MITSNFALSDVLTSDFLIFSWFDIKNNKKPFSTILLDEISLPVSKSWFEKTSLLIKKGKTFYNFNQITRINRYNLKKDFLVNIKTNIIENAIVLILEPFFFDSIGSRVFNLIEC